MLRLGLVPGSHKVLNAIKEEGILDQLHDAGFELREPGCSACLAMNDDKIPAGKYAVSTSTEILKDDKVQDRVPFWPVL